MGPVSIRNYGKSLRGSPGMKLSISIGPETDQRTCKYCEGFLHNLFVHENCTIFAGQFCGEKNLLDFT